MPPPGGGGAVIFPLPSQCHRSPPRCTVAAVRLRPLPTPLLTLRYQINAFQRRSGQHIRRQRATRTSNGKFCEARNGARRRRGR